MRLFRPLVGVMLAATALLACKREDPISATDPFPMPTGMEENKDLPTPACTTTPATGMSIATPRKSS